MAKISEKATAGIVNPETGEVGGPEVETANAVTVFDPSKISIVKQVTFPLLKQSAGEKVFVQFESAIFVGEKVEENKDAANLAIVTTPFFPGKSFHYIVPAVLKSSLEKAYLPDDNGVPEYVGKKFAIAKGDKRQGKNYSEFEVIEVSW